MRGRRQRIGREKPAGVAPKDQKIAIHLDESAPTTERAAQYRDWADRLHQKRETARRHIRGTGTEDPLSYWATDNVFRESRRVIDGEMPTRSDPAVQELLAVFGIEGEPTPRQVETEFRRLAKQHHPDRHVGADEATRAYHLDQMRRINEAYARLRQLELA